MSHLRDVIVDHLHDCLGIIVADTEPCIGVHAAIPADKRDSRRATQSDLDAAWFRSSYVVAVVLCPGDSTKKLAAFAAKHKLDPDRFHFYHPPGVDPIAALRDWRTAGFHVHSIEEVDKWGPVNQHFAAHWNHVIHDQLCKKAGCVMHVLD